MKKVISALLAGAISLTMLMPAFAAEEESFKVYIAPYGDNSNDGTSLSSAVATLDRVQEIVRANKKSDRKTEVIFYEGEYLLDEGFTLTSEDSGTEAAPIIYRPYENKTVTLSVAKKITADEFSISTNSEIAASAKGKVYEADLSAFSDLAGGTLDTLYSDYNMLSLSKYPNEGDNWSDTALSLSQYTETDDDGNVTVPDTSVYALPDEITGKLTDKTDLLFEYKVNGYSYAIAQSSEITVTDDTIKLPNSVGYIMNTLYGVDSPGEYYIDTAAKKLYYYPVSAIADTYIATGVDNVITLDGASNIKFENIDFFCGNNSAVSMTDSDNITIYDSVMKGFGANAIYTEKTTNLLVAGCSISDMKNGGIDISSYTRVTGNNISSEQVTLTESNNIIRNCRVYDVGNLYKTGGAIINHLKVSGAAINIDGCGATVANNEVYDAPATGIWFSGNSHIIENNKVYNVIRDVWDAGAIYCGRSWVDRGTVIRNNYIYNEKSVADYTAVRAEYVYKGGTDNAAIYLDDVQSGITVTGNVIYNMSEGLLIGGGSDNTISDNLIIGCRRGYWYDNQGMGGWRVQHIDREWAYQGSIAKKLDNLLASSEYDENVWTSEYDSFAGMLERFETFNTEDARIKADTTMTDTEKATARSAALKALGTPTNVLLDNNICVGEWADLYGTGADYNLYMLIESPVNQNTNSFDIITADAAGISVAGDYTITASGSGLTDGLMTTTANAGVGTETYIPTYSSDEFEVNPSNSYTVVAAIYTDGKMIGVEFAHKVHLYNGQAENIEITLPENTADGSYVKLMLWDSVEGLKPLSQFTYTVGN